MALIGAAVVGGVIAAAVVADDEADDRINGSNQAAEEGDPSAGGAGEVSTFDLRVGDCFQSDALDGSDDVELEAVDRVDCAEEWDGRVSESFLLADGDYPGEPAIEAQVVERCPALTDYYLFPTEETWELGDRAILCVDLR
jgi:hypothetical protein